MIRPALLLLALTSACFLACRADSAATAERATVVAAPRAVESTAAGESASREVAVQLIPLGGVAAEDFAELSGLAWFGDLLILLPQYPDRFDSAHQGALLAIARADLEARIDHASDLPIEPTRVDLVAPGLFDRIRGFDGFESIAFAGERAYLTIEAKERDRMVGYLVRGEMAADGARLVIDTDTLAEIPMATDLSNVSDEAVLVLGDRVLTLHEANGERINPSPRAHAFDTSLHALGTIPFPAVEYRVTDASSADADHRFWVINYLYSRDRAKYRAEADPIADRYGRGETHRRSRSVERLLELQYTESGIRLVERPPIALRDPGDRNWEGLVRLGERGFLLVTDRHPETLLGFVPLPR